MVDRTQLYNTLESRLINVKQSVNNFLRQPVLTVRMSTRLKIVDVVGFVWQKFMQNMEGFTNIIKQNVVHVGNKLRQQRVIGCIQAGLNSMLYETFTTLPVSCTSKPTSRW